MPKFEVKIVVNEKDQIEEHCETPKKEASDPQPTQKKTPNTFVTGGSIDHLPDSS